MHSATTPTPTDLFARVAHLPGAVWLDGGEAGPWSILSWNPQEIVTDGEDWPAVGRSLVRDVAPRGVPFAGGCIGYLGYAAGHRVDAVPPVPVGPVPEVWLARYPGGLCFRHADATWHPAGTPGFVADATALLADARRCDPPAPVAGARQATSWSRRRFEDGVRTIRAWIEAGDCYQVNLTRPVRVTGERDPWSAYQRLRALSAPAFGAFLRLDAELAVLSNSPELFLEVDGKRVCSLPIKGTRPRGADEAADRTEIEVLAASAKDRAELTMIVDLVRNDLSRVAARSSVRAGPREIVSHANVHHAQQRVSAVLAPGRDAWSALAASFPPGSVTGAPKVRACQRIAELEQAPRGVYCGAIGFVADGGAARWSVAIRTAVWTGDAVTYHVGGGIVHGSDPTAEWWETVDKGTVLARAFTGRPWAVTDERRDP